MFTRQETRPKGSVGRNRTAMRAEYLFGYKSFHTVSLRTRGSYRRTVLQRRKKSCRKMVLRVEYANISPCENTIIFCRLPRYVVLPVTPPPPPPPLCVYSGLIVDSFFYVNIYHIWSQTNICPETPRNRRLCLRRCSKIPVNNQTTIRSCRVGLMPPHPSSPMT